jgi:hypothetical protein
MEELIARVVARTGLDPELASKAVGIIFAFLQKEAPAEEVTKMFAALPGAEALAAANADTGGGGGLMGAIGGMMGGGGLMALAGKLTGAGVGMGQMQGLGNELFAYGREKAGEDTMGAIVGAVPGLGQFV